MRLLAATFIGLIVLSSTAVPMGTAAPLPAPVPEIRFLDGYIDQTVLVAPEHVPAPSDGAGIGPGSKLLITGIASGTALCTSNFVWKTATKFYLGTAGHCLIGAGKTATHGPGADWNPAGVTVRACVSACTFGGQTGFIITGTMVALGPVAYARMSAGGVAVGNDFGLVEIPASLVPSIRSSVPVWGGPIGSATTLNVGHTVCYFGHGVATGETTATKARVGQGLGTFASGEYQIIGSSAGGDSGMAVVRCGTDSAGVHGMQAVGIHTHGLVVPGVPGPRFGTFVTKAVTMATEAGLSISLVNGL